MWRAEPWEGEGFGRALLGVGARGRNRGLDRKRRETAQSMAAQQCAGGKRSRDASEALNDVAGTFRCSITSSLVLDPVTTCDGQLYERGAIEEWLTMHSTSPNTGERLSSKMLTPSQAIKGAVERLVFSGCLAPEESREWMLRKAVTMLAKGEDTEAQPLLERALVEGEAAAGWHLGRLLIIQRAANAGVAEAAADVTKLNDTSLAGGSRWLTMDDVKVGDFVRFLPEDEAEAAFMFHNQLAARREWAILEWREHGSLEGEVRYNRVAGKRLKIVETDLDDCTVRLRGWCHLPTRERLTVSLHWWPVACLVCA